MMVKIGKSTLIDPKLVTSVCQDSYHGYRNVSLSNGNVFRVENTIDELLRIINDGLTAKEWTE